MKNPLPKVYKALADVKDSFWEDLEDFRRDPMWQLRVAQGRIIKLGAENQEFKERICDLEKEIGVLKDEIKRMRGIARDGDNEGSDNALG